MLNGTKTRKPLGHKGYRRPPYKYIIPEFMYDCPLKYREFSEKVSAGLTFCQGGYRCPRWIGRD